MTAQDYVLEWRRAVLFDGRDGAQRVYSALYFLRDRRRFELLDRCLDLVCVDDFDGATLVGMLMATAAAARQLASREGFYRRVRERLVALQGEASATRELAGLACEEGWNGVPQ